MPQDFEATPATASVRVTRPASPVPCFAPSQSPNSTAAKPSSALQILPEARAIEAADEVIRCVDGECSNPLPAGRKFRDGVATTVEPPTPTPAVAPAPAAPTSIIGSWRGNVTLTMAQKGQTPSTQSDEVTFEIERALFIATNDTMNTSTNSPKPIECSGHSWRPVAYVAMLERSARQRIVSVLEHAGWAVIPQPSGFHLLQAIAGVIDGHQAWLRPGLIVVDAHSPGCAGTTIAAGLRDLGITIPIVLIAAPGEALPVSPDQTLRIVDSDAAEGAVAELAARATRPPLDDQPAA